jgi:DNA-binding XRE family transcriptional regulator
MSFHLGPAKRANSPPRVNRCHLFFVNSDDRPWDYYRSPSQHCSVGEAKGSGRKESAYPASGRPRACVWRRLAEVRKEHGVSQVQLALDSGLDRTYVSLVERGVQSPTIRSVVKFASVLGVESSEILFRMESLMLKHRAIRPKASRADSER